MIVVSISDDIISARLAVIGIYIVCYMCPVFSKQLCFYFVCKWSGAGGARYTVLKFKEIPKYVVLKPYVTTCQLLFCSVVMMSLLFT